MKSNASNGAAATQQPQQQRIEGGALGQYEVLQTEELTSDAPSIDPHSQALPVQVGAQSDDLQVSSGMGLGLGMDSWCLPPLPLINGVAVRFAESASNLGRQIAKVVEETVAPLPLPSANNSAMASGRIQEFIDAPNVVALAPRADGGEIVESSSVLSSLGIEQASLLLSSTSKVMLGMGQQILNGPPAAWNGLVTRVQTTMRGSADDIGWLQKMPNSLPMVDGTSGFLEALDMIRHGVHILPNTVTYLLIPGLFSNHGPLYFVDTKRHFSKLGLACHIAKIHSEAAVETNAAQVKEHIKELYWGTKKKVVLLGHSKGGVDAAAACSMFWNELKDKVVGLALIQSPYGGSPVAADILREGQIGDYETRTIMEMLISKVIKGDIQALEDLTYEKRRQFLAKYSYPPDLPTICFHTEASRSPGWVATMSHIAHADLPWLSGGTSSSSEEPVAGIKLPVAVPLAAVMAMFALHLEIRYSEKSDGLVTRKDAEVPGSIVVKPEKKLDHGWMVYSPARKDPLEPDAAQMCEAVLTLLLNHDKWNRPGTRVTPEAAAVLNDAKASATARLEKSFSFSTKS